MVQCLLCFRMGVGRLCGIQRTTEVMSPQRLSARIEFKSDLIRQSALGFRRLRRFVQRLRRFGTIGGNILFFIVGPSQSPFRVVGIPSLSCPSFSHCYVQTQYATTILKVRSPTGKQEVVRMFGHLVRRVVYVVRRGVCLRCSRVDFGSNRFFLGQNTLAGIPLPYGFACLAGWLGNG